MLKIILGAGDSTQVGWLSTEQHELDLLQPASFARFGLLLGTVDAFLAEHVWEHLSADHGLAAAQLCYQYLLPGGYLRLAVPDGNHPDPAYQDWVRPGGTGPGCDTHQMLYNWTTLTALLTAAGFLVRLLEYWDDQGSFHYQTWSYQDGVIQRCAALDERNRTGWLAYTSLIVDAIKE